MSLNSQVLDAQLLNDLRVKQVEEVTDAVSVAKLLSHVQEAKTLQVASGPNSLKK